MRTGPVIEKLERQMRDEGFILLSIISPYGEGGEFISEYIFHRTRLSASQLEEKYRQLLGCQSGQVRVPNEYCYYEGEEGIEVGTLLFVRTEDLPDILRRNPAAKAMYERAPHS